MTWSELSAHATGLAHIATADSTGKPFVAVVSPAVEGGVIWVATMKSSAKYRSLLANPRISIMWATGPELYVQGRVELIDEPSEKQRIWHSGLLPYDPAMFFGNPENPDLVLIKITPVTATLQTMGQPAVRWKA
jgi:general stress protein 26